jgi:LPS-assembly protein
MLQFAFVIFLLLGTPQDPPEVTIEASQQERTGDFTRYTGNVIATYLDLRVEADTVTYDESTGILTADGDIRYNRGEEHLEADHVTYNLDTKVGDFTNVKGEVGPGFFITAQQAHRAIGGQYELTNATVTTCCEGPRPGWTMALARARVDPHRRVTAKSSVVRLENVPVFYMPYVAVPSSDRSRSTGFLIPSTATSTAKGRSVRESFYWAINRSADATFTGEYFTKRGPAGGVDFRAIPDKTSRIQFESLFARDRLGQGGWSGRILSYGGLGHDFRGVADLNLVSSFKFRQVYEDGLNTISSPLQASHAFVTRNQPYLSSNFLYARDGVFFTDPDRPTVVLRKFPTFDLSLPSRQIGSLPFYLSGDTSAAGVARSDDVIKTPTMVERFDLHPVLEMPIVHSSLLDWSQRIGIRETAYTNSRESQLVVGDALNRLSFEYSSSFVGPQIERDFGRWRHVIEPTVDTHFVGGVDRFRDTIVVDDVDLITRTNDVEYGVTNRFFTTREVFSWRLAQKYFLDPTFGGALIPGKRNVFAPVLDISGFAFADGIRRFSPIISTMRLSTSASSSTDFEVDYDARDHRFSAAGIVGNLNRGQFGGGISYFFTRRSAIEIPNNQLRGSLTYGNQLKPGLSAAFSFSYDAQHSIFQGSTAQVGYNTNCFGLSFEMSQVNLGFRVESRFRFAFTLKDIGSVGTLRRQERLF